MTEFKFSERQYEKLGKCLDALDEHPEAWMVYGENVRYYMEGMWQSLCELRHHKRKLLGRTGDRRTTNIYRPDLQQKLRKEKFELSPRCEAPAWTDCLVRGCDLDWDAVQIDHIVSVTDGGETTHENTRLLCAICHAVISAKSRRGKSRYNTLGRYIGV